MSLNLREALGFTEAVIDTDGSLKRFYQVAAILSEELQAHFINKEDDFHEIRWDFLLHQHRLTLQYSIYSGISIFPTKAASARRKDNHALIELATVLEGKLLRLDMKKGVA